MNVDGGVEKQRFRPRPRGRNRNGISDTEKSEKNEKVSRKLVNRKKLLKKVRGEDGEELSQRRVRVKPQRKKKHAQKTNI